MNRVDEADFKVKLDLIVLLLARLIATQSGADLAETLDELDRQLKNEREALLRE